MIGKRVRVKNGGKGEVLSVGKGLKVGKWERINCGEMGNG